MQEINWQSASYLPKYTILVGKEPHCLIDLLARKRTPNVAGSRNNSGD